MFVATGIIKELFLSYFHNTFTVSVVKASIYRSHALRGNAAGDARVTHRWSDAGFIHTQSVGTI